VNLVSRHLCCLKEISESHFPVPILFLLTHSLAEKQKLKREKYLLYLREYRQRNREKILQVLRDHYHKNREKRLLDMQEYFEKNRETKLQYQREYHKKNREERCRSLREDYQKNRDRRLRNMQNYYQKNRVKRIVYMQNYFEKNREKRRQDIHAKKKAEGLPPPREYSSWKSVDEIRTFLEKVAELYHIQSWPNDWYRISIKQVQIAGGV
jgi:hypothetical protein